MTTTLSATRSLAYNKTPIDIGSRLELFVDETLVHSFEGDATLHLHKPRGKEVVLASDKPWEDGSMNYFAVLRDGDIFRMYYRGHHHGSSAEARGEPMCYAESKDGIHWVKPNLGLFTFKGSAENNIVLGGDGRKFPATDKWRGKLGMDTGLGWRGDMVPFIDKNPNAQPDARYKALVRGARGPHQTLEGQSDYGMYPFKSPDGIHWTLMSEKPVITRGKFDSQNLAIWDSAHNRYVAFSRDMRWGTADKPLSNAPSAEAYEVWRTSLNEARRNTEDVDLSRYGGVRDIRMSTSTDFVHWSDPVLLEHPDEIDREFYTNAIIPYERAPHILLGFPTEMVSLFSFEGSEVNPIFMVSRDGGRAFLVRGEPLIPREAPAERDGNRANYMAHGIVRGNDREYFVYATEGYGVESVDKAARLRRFIYRIDGFVSVRAGPQGGAVVTRPIIFSGDRLVVNSIAWPSYRSGVQVELQDVDGRPLKDCAMEDCNLVEGDAIEQQVTWKSGVDLGTFAGRPVRLRFSLRHADLFSFQFTKDDETGSGVKRSGE